jgi:hypothetical protein
VPAPSVIALAATATPGGVESLMRPTTVSPGFMASGGSTRPTLA